MLTEIRQKQDSGKNPEKNVTEKVDNKKFDFYYREVQSKILLIYMQILSTAFGKAVESSFVYLNRRELLKVGALSLALSFLPMKNTAKAMETGTNDTKDKIENVLSSTDPIDYEKLTPVQKKMYDHFIKSEKWTYEKMEALKGKEWATEVLVFLDKSDIKEAWMFYDKLLIEKKIQQTNKETAKLLGSSK